MAKNSKKVSSIGGQAVIEGVMMRGKRAMATAVRDEYGEIVVESERFKISSSRRKLSKVPIVRGVIAFFDSMVNGVKILLKSAEVYGGDMGEPTKFEKWLAEKTKINVMDIAIFIGLVLGLALSIGLFFILPQLITTGIVKIFGIDDIHNILLNLIEGVIRLSIFIAYILLVSLLKDIKRTFMYHGAEHKVINCYEQDKDLNIKNVQEMSTINDRCGTTFLFFVMIVAILIFSLVPRQDQLWMRILIRLALLPAVAGISYELLKLFAKSDNVFVKIFKAPGKLLQKITTKEPTDDMVEVSLKAFNTVNELETNENVKEQKFILKKSYKNTRAEVKSILKDVTLEEAEIDWIICEVTKLKRSELNLTKYILIEQYEEIIKIAKERATGRPLQYVLGEAEFYGIKLKVDERALIPRPETEILIESALDSIKDDSRVLDLCTGSGAIAIAISKNTNAKVIASDISKDALFLAKENAETNNCKIDFFESDLFDNLEGQFDIILCNPPYIKSDIIDTLDKGVKNYEPIEALDGGDDGLVVIKKIISQLPKYLKGSIFMEIGYDQSESVIDLFQSNGYKADIIKDLEGKDRIIKAVANV